MCVCVNICILSCSSRTCCFFKGEKHCLVFSSNKLLCTCVLVLCTYVLVLFTCVLVLIKGEGRRGGGVNKFTVGSTPGKG